MPHKVTEEESISDDRHPKPLFCHERAHFLISEAREFISAAGVLGSLRKAWVIEATLPNTKKIYQLLILSISLPHNGKVAGSTSYPVSYRI